MTLSPTQKLATAIVRVSHPRVGFAPYFGAVLRGFVRRVMPPEMEAAMTALLGTPTIGVTRDGILYWSESFVAKQSVDDLAWILLHEVMHVVLRHHTRTDAMKIADEMRPIANIAQDACINEELEKVRAPVPAGCILPETIEQPRGLVFEERYRLLVKEMKKRDGKNRKAGSGWCGGCSGNPIPGEPDPKKGKSEGRSEAAMDRIRRETAEAVKAHVQKTGTERGTVPASLVRWAEELLAPPQIDWRTKLGQLVRQAVAYRPGAVDFDWMHLSRRQSGVGYGVGRPVLPAYRSPVPRVSVLLDTSGSMSKEDLTDALAEVQGVVSAVGAEITFAVCDAAVHGIAEVSTAKAAAEMLKGGGGTNMRPGLDALAERSPRAEVVIVLTDGAIGDPGPEIEWARVIWVVIGKNGNNQPATWGEIVVVEEMKRSAA